MPATMELPPPAWRILPTDGGHFQWTLHIGDPHPRPKVPPKTLILENGDAGSRFPSMADLLVRAPPKLLEGDGGGSGEVGPLFRTGSGRSVSVRQSSIKKARFVLEAGETSVPDRDAAITVAGGSNEGFPMFRTGSGKSVMVKQSSMRKAAAVLEAGAPEKDETECPTVSEGGGGNHGFPLFRSGSGKSLMVGQSSIKKATAILEEVVMEKGPLKCDSKNDGTPMFQTGSGKSVLLKESSIRKAMSVLEDVDIMEKGPMCNFAEDGDCSFPDSFFRTGSGKSVNISPAGLRRATTLLGLDHNDKLSTSNYIEHVNNHDNVQWKVKLGMDSTIKVHPVDAREVQRNSNSGSRNFHSSGNLSFKNVDQNSLRSEVFSSKSVLPPLPPIKFQTAGGKSISVCADALQRARNLLGDSELESLHNDVKADPQRFLIKDEVSGEASWNKENIPVDSSHQNSSRRMHKPESLAHVRHFTNPKKSPSSHRGATSQNFVLNKVNANGLSFEGIHHSSSQVSHFQKPLSKDVDVSHTTVNRSGVIPEVRHSGWPLVEISNNISTDYAHVNGSTSAKKRLRRRSSISPFKRPRSSRFTTPLNSSTSLLTTDSTLQSTSEDGCCRTRVSTCYPFQYRRKSLEEFFGGPPSKHSPFALLPERVKHMNADNAEIYRFHHASGSNGIGPEAFRNMLLQSGASALNATKEWVANHYKWIVWKLACLERCYPAEACGKLLTVSNVLEELKYRYEREVNYGHRSAIKRILDGDASPASMMILCISSIHYYSNLRVGNSDGSADLDDESKQLHSLDGDASNRAVKIELTDGWYSMGANLDVLMSKQLVAGKLFVGQKLRIWGAGLCGWVGPLSPFEASKTVTLLLHINGTYRAHWSDPLGLCKGLGAPLAFRCIKGAGGKVPRTLVGVTRIYPVLFKERFADGSSIVRTEKMEKKVLQLYNQRRSNIVEDIMSAQHDVSVNASDSEEGARIFKILENAAEPEVLMADMSSEQLISFSAFQAKQEATRQSNIQKKIEKALEDAGLSSRDVTPFMRVRVVGLTSKGSHRKGHPRGGLITIWNPTEKQKLDLVEGHIYTVAGLTPLNFGSAETLYLQANGSSTVWKSLPSIESEKYEPFFTPRKSILLSNLGEVPLASEFDIAAVIVHVGDVYISGRWKKQWIFVTDGSKCSSGLQLDELYDNLLAISFCSPITDNDSSALLSQCLSGTTVGLCNLVKRPKDQLNHLWVAEATENSTYSICNGPPCGFHLKEATDSAQKWVKVSGSTIQKLKERILCIIGARGS